MSLFKQLVSILFIVLTSNPIAAEEGYRVDLPELMGTHSTAAISRPASFDVGKSFSAIQRVRIFLSGVAHPGTAMTHETDETTDLPASLRLDFADRFPNFDLNIPVARFGPLDLSFDEESEAFGSMRGADWTFLKDGKGEVKLSWDRVCPGPCRFLNHATVKIHQAYLLIEGTPE